MNIIELTVGLDVTYARSQRRHQPRTRLPVLMHEGVFCNRRARIHPDPTTAAVNARLISQPPLSPSNTEPVGIRRTLYDLDSTQLRLQPAARRPFTTTIMNITRSTGLPNRTTSFELRYTSNNPTARFSWLPSAVASGFNPRCSKRNTFRSNRNSAPTLICQKPSGEPQMPSNFIPVRRTVSRRLPCRWFHTTGPQSPTQNRIRRVTAQPISGTTCCGHRE
jgi:hypothetical protein